MNTSLAPAISPNASGTTTPPASPSQTPWTLRGSIARVVRSIRSLGPYLAIELILPGGTVIALALWTYRHRQAARDSLKTTTTAIISAVRRAPLRWITPCTER